jgi:amino acid transporter
VGIAVSAAIPCLHAWIIHGDVDRLANLVLAAVCAWGVAYVLVTLSVISLRVRRPDLRRPYRSPAFPTPQILSIVGVVIAIVYIAPVGTSPAAVFEPFGIMLVLKATYALVWTKFVRRVPLFNPLPVEEVLAKEFAAAPATVDQISASTPATISSAANR